ncbi:hypothetical protein ACFE04_025279 [Oxalis oulophora]
MATVSTTTFGLKSSFNLSFKSNEIGKRTSTLKMVTGGWSKTSRLRISCSAKPETVEKVSDIVRKQLALPAETTLTPASKFSELGADSLDTVEIVMTLEEEFDISVEEESSQNITTVQEAADLIEKLVQKKAEA